jgi:hypothetical protein
MSFRKRLKLKLGQYQGSVQSRQWFVIVIDTVCGGIMEGLLILYS